MGRVGHGHNPASVAARNRELSTRVGKLTGGHDDRGARVEHRAAHANFEVRTLAFDMPDRGGGPPRAAVVGRPSRRGRTLLPTLVILAVLPSRSASSPASTPTCCGSGRSATRRCSPARSWTKIAAVLRVRPARSPPRSAVNFVVAYRLAAGATRRCPRSSRARPLPDGARPLPRDRRSAVIARCSA